MAYYHGTSTVMGISTQLETPDNHSAGMNEGRCKNTDKVFFTTEKGYAGHYARRACSRVGGSSVIYEVFPDNPILMVDSDGCDVYYESGSVRCKKIEPRIWDNVKRRK